jgi:hypothetical protein
MVGKMGNELVEQKEKMLEDEMVVLKVEKLECSSVVE